MSLENLIEKTGVLQTLVRRGIYKLKNHSEPIRFSNVELTSTGKRYFKPVDNDVGAWIEEYRNIFPAQTYTGGKPVRTNLKDCTNRMEKFFKKYPYTKEQVLEATRSYVGRKSLDRYNFISTAGYFILKNNTSALADEIENSARGDNVVWDDESI